MKERDKELLLKDLSARLSYGVILKDSDGQILFLDGVVRCSETDMSKGYILAHEYKVTWSYVRKVALCDIKPYLRPLSSMTEEEAITIFKIIYGDDTEFSSVEVSDNCIEIWDYDYNEDGFSERTVCTIYFEEIVRSMEILDYLLSRHFDIPRWDKSKNTYKTIIEKGLALSAPDGMYNF